MDIPFGFTFLAVNPTYFIIGMSTLLVIGYFFIKKIKIQSKKTSQAVDEKNSFLASYQENTQGNLLEEARILANYGKFEKATVILTGLIKTQPDLETAYFELLLIYFHQENQQACIDLLNKLPFEKDSAIYQNFLANIKMEFPESLQPIKSLQPIESLQPENSLKPNKSLQPENSLQSSNSLQPENSLQSSKSLQPENNIHHSKSLQPKSTSQSQKSLSKNTHISLAKQQIQSTKLLQFDPEIEINKLDKLELLVFKSFKTNAVVENKFVNYLDRYEKIWQKLSDEKPIYQNLIDIQENELETLAPESLIYNRAKQLMENQKYSQASELLEQNLLQHTEYEKLYDLLMQNYLLVNDIDAYYQFRDAIFSHQQQPSLETILLLSDTETQILEKMEMVA